MVIRNHNIMFLDYMADYQDMVARANDDEVLADLLTWALNAMEGAPILNLSRMRVDSNLIRAISLLEPDFCFESLERQEDCCYIPLDGDYEAYLASRSRSCRKDLRQAWRRAERNGVRVVELAPGDMEPLEAPGRFLHFHLQRFSDTSCFHKPMEQAFLHAGLPILFTERRLRIFGLYQNEQLMGMDLYMVGANSLGAWNGGYTAEMIPWSPGKLFIIHAIKTGFSEGLHEIDFLHGTHPWKSHWTDSRRQIGFASIQNNAFGDGIIVKSPVLQNH